MGYGIYSSTFTFIPRKVPAKPVTAPRNVTTSTYRNTIYISYDAFAETGGSAIINYNIYVDDGINGTFTGPYKNGVALTYNTVALTLTTGRYYRIKYSASNLQGEGALSDQVSILLAEVTSVPTTFLRIDSTILPAG